MNVRQVAGRLARSRALLLFTGEYTRTVLVRQWRAGAGPRAGRTGRTNTRVNESVLCGSSPMGYDEIRHAPARSPTPGTCPMNRASFGCRLKEAPRSIRSTWIAELLNCVNANTVTPAAGQIAVVPLADQNTATDTRSFTWTVSDAIRFPSTSAATAVVGVSKSLSMAGTDSISSDTLTYSATGLPAGLAMNSSTGLISGTPSLSDAVAGSVSLYTASLTLTDNHSGTDHQSLTWYITNPTFSWSMTPVAAPSVTNPGSQSSAEGASISLAFHDSGPHS